MVIPMHFMYTNNSPPRLAKWFMPAVFLHRPSVAKAKIVTAIERERYRLYASMYTCNRSTALFWVIGFPSSKRCLDMDLMCPMSPNSCVIKSINVVIVCMHWCWMWTPAVGLMWYWLAAKRACMGWVSVQYSLLIHFAKSTASKMYAMHLRQNICPLHQCVDKGSIPLLSPGAWLTRGFVVKTVWK